MRGLRCAATASLLLLGACTHTPPPGVGEAISWSQLPGWNEDRQREAWPALLANCRVMATRDTQWKSVCDNALALTDVDDAGARAFFETHFTPHVVIGADGAVDGLFTGYYEPLLQGSRTRSERFRFPVYARPDDLLTVDLGELYPELKGKRLRGRLDGRRVVPYHSRAQIDNGTKPAAEPIVWVDDPVALFFLHIQGSGRVQLPDGSLAYLGYSDQNGHPYRAIGRELIDRGALAAEDVSMQAIRDWIVANPQAARPLLDSNPSYVFFEERASVAPGPLGSLNVALTAERSIAVDPAFVTLGSAVWLETSLPDAAPYRRLAFAQDTGGAIRGPVRADVFFGFGARAEELAGRMKQPGRLYVLRLTPPVASN